MNNLVIDLIDEVRADLQTIKLSLITYDDLNADEARAAYPRLLRAANLVYFLMSEAKRSIGAEGQGNENAP